VEGGRESLDSDTEGIFGISLAQQQLSVPRLREEVKQQEEAGEVIEAQDQWDERARSEGRNLPVDEEYYPLSNPVYSHDDHEFDENFHILSQFIFVNVTSEEATGELVDDQEEEDGVASEENHDREMEVNKLWEVVPNEAFGVSPDVWVEDPGIAIGQLLDQERHEGDQGREDEGKGLKSPDQTLPLLLYRPPQRVPEALEGHPNVETHGKEPTEDGDGAELDEERPTKTDGWLLGKVS